MAGIPEITPIHQSLETVREAIRMLKLTEAALISQLPVVPKVAPLTHLIHPITGKKMAIKGRRKS